MGCVRETVIVAQGDISPGDIILQVNGDAVGGFIHWDLLCEIRRSGSLLTLLLVPQGGTLHSFPFIIWGYSLTGGSVFNLIFYIICPLCRCLLCHYASRCSSVEQRVANYPANELQLGRSRQDHK